ncbi:glycoside hydrolase family 2 protein [Proteiniclasticum sp. C24MP]|uniref:glycoside hydrolase family 2 protein n=1 Tax=Proteiniclasticum sp. C24MP TaxID=3374101 RepID=UPI003753FC07
MREKIHLNESWMFYPDVEDYPKTSGELKNRKGEHVDLPHTVKMLPFNNFNEKEYQFKSLYRKDIFIDEEYRNKSLFLVFEGAANMTVVYINGKKSFHSESAFLPFSKEISEEVRFGETNTIEVMVDSRELEWIPPFGHVVDFLTYGGIYREVSLEIHDRYFIQNVFAFAEHVMEEEKQLTVQTILSAERGGSVIYKLFEGSDTSQSGEALFSSIRNVDEKRMRNTLSIKGVSLWDIDHPHLYTLEVTLVDPDGRAVDRKTETIGFREAMFKEDGFYLNGRKIKLRGLNRHQSYPYVGYAMPKSMQILDAEILKKDLGVNIVRTSHYPQSSHFLDHCDRIGLLVFEEIPGWQHIGDEHFKENSKDNLKKMLKRDRNHPSIIIWGVRINESQDDTVFYEEMNRIAHIYDESRPTGGVRNFAKSEFLEDVYTYNDFLHKGDNEGLSSPNHILPSKAPYLVTEHNGHMYPVKSADPEERRTEHALRHARVLESMEKNSKISGAIGWCMADYNTHVDFGSGDRVCYHGVLDMFRQKKTAAFVYSSQKEEPVLHISSSMNIGDHAGGNLGNVYAFTNCDYVDLYKNGRRIRRFEKDRKKKLKHPPILMADFIGNLLEEDEGFSGGDAERVKKIIRKAAVYGMNLPLTSKMAMGRILLKYKMKMDDAVALFGKYYAGWGQDQLTYTFKGYKNEKEVATVTKGPGASMYLEVIPSKEELLVEETYDVAMVSVCAKNNHEDILVYSSEVIRLETEGNVEILGPAWFPLRGGQGAFYVRSGRGEGDGAVKILTENMGEKEIRFTVRDGGFRKL